MKKSSKRGSRADNRVLELEAYRLRLYGWTIFEIARAIGRKPEWVKKAISRAETLFAKYQQEEVERVRDRFIRRLEDVVAQSFPKLQEGELRAADVIVRATQLQARMLGIEEGNRVAQEAAARLMRELVNRIGLFQSSSIETVETVDPLELPARSELEEEASEN